MKTLITCIATTIFTIGAVNTSAAQAMFVTEADVFLGSEESNATFTLAELKITGTGNTVAASWEAFNQSNITRYELQLSEDNSIFSTVKKVNSVAAVNSGYQINLANTVILADKVFYRIKIVSNSGAVLYTASKTLSILNL